MVEDDENIEWKIPEETEEESEESEDEGEEETEPELENIIEPSTQGFRRSLEVTPFLEAAEQPIENLEQDLQDVPGQTAQTQEEQEEQATYTVNAPQYSSNYDEARYEVSQEAQRPTDPEMADVSLMRRETDLRGMAGAQERTINFQRWQQANVERGPEQQERYIRDTKQIKEEDKLPFQRKRKRLF